jgi:hydrogenase maturation protease
MTDSRIVLLAVGNPLMGDDGLGLALLDRLAQGGPWPPGTALLDGGTWGMNLLPVIEEATHLVLLDAVRTGAEPGTVVVLGRDELPRALAHKLSPHQIDLKEVLALAELRGTLPAHLAAVGVEPERVDWGTELSVPVAARLDEAVAAVRRTLENWGVSTMPVEVGRGA